MRFLVALVAALYGVYAPAPTPDEMQRYARARFTDDERSFVQLWTKAAVESRRDVNLWHRLQFSRRNETRALADALEPWLSTPAVPKPKCYRPEDVERMARGSVSTGNQAKFVEECARNPNITYRYRQSLYRWTDEEDPLTARNSQLGYRVDEFAKWREVQRAGIDRRTQRQLHAVLRWFRQFSFHYQWVLPDGTKVELDDAGLGDLRIGSSALHEQNRGQWIYLGYEGRHRVLGKGELEIGLGEGIVLATVNFDDALPFWLFRQLFALLANEEIFALRHEIVAALQAFDRIESWTELSAALKTFTGPDRLARHLSEMCGDMARYGAWIPKRLRQEGIGDFAWTPLDVLLGTTYPQSGPSPFEIFSGAPVPFEVLEHDRFPGSPLRLRASAYPESSDGSSIDNELPTHELPRFVIEALRGAKIPNYWILAGEHPTASRYNISYGVAPSLYLRSASWMVTDGNGVLEIPGPRDHVLVSFDIHSADGVPLTGPESQFQIYQADEEASVFFIQLPKVRHRRVGIRAGFAEVPRPTKRSDPTVADWALSPELHRKAIEWVRLGGLTPWASAMETAPHTFAGIARALHDSSRYPYGRVPPGSTEDNGTGPLAGHCDTLDGDGHQSMQCHRSRILLRLLFDALLKEDPTIPLTVKTQVGFFAKRRDGHTFLPMESHTWLGLRNEDWYIADVDGTPSKADPRAPDRRIQPKEKDFLSTAARAAEARAARENRPLKPWTELVRSAHAALQSEMDVLNARHRANKREIGAMVGRRTSVGDVAGLMAQAIQRLQQAPNEQELAPELTRWLSTLAETKRLLEALPRKAWNDHHLSALTLHATTVSILAPLQRRIHRCARAMAATGTSGTPQAFP